MALLPLRQVALLAILLSVTVRAQNVTCPDGSNPQGRVTVTGQGSVTNTPDLATVSDGLTLHGHRPQRRLNQVSIFLMSRLTCVLR